MGAERLRWLRAWACALVPWVFGLAAEEVLAQGVASAVPATNEMIEALKPARQRNLLVRPTAAPASAASAAPAPTPTLVAVPVQAPVPTAIVTPAPVAAAPQPQAPAASPPAGPADGPPSLSLAIQFDLNSARVRPESGAVLGNLVAAMLSADLRNNRFLIEGHTDARGNAGANQVLSQRRAEEVRLYLVALGVHPARLKAVGKGSSEPANPRDPLAGDNRRVRVVTLE